MKRGCNGISLRKQGFWKRKTLIGVSDAWSVQVDSSVPRYQPGGYRVHLEKIPPFVASLLATRPSAPIRGVRCFAQSMTLSRLLTALGRTTCTSLKFPPWSGPRRSVEQVIVVIADRGSMPVPTLYHNPLPRGSSPSNLLLTTFLSTSTKSSGSGDHFHSRPPRSPRGIS